jgi:diguanylate cyclase (GGDEF)-like protein
VSALNRYVTAVSVGGFATLVLIVLLGGEHAVSRLDESLLWLGLCILVAECFPLRLSRSVGEFATSVSFTFALLWTDGIVVAVFVQVVASMIADLLRGKGLRRISFNAGQYALAWTAAGLALEAIGHASAPPSGAFRLVEHLPALMVGGGVFFIANFCLATTAPALAEGTRVIDALREQLRFEAGTVVLLIGFAPIIATISVIEVELTPLLGLPLLAIYLGGRESIRNEHQALHDALTGLPNRLLLRGTLTRELAAARRDGTSVGVLVMDLDGFKDVNDTLGHGHGDLLLQQVGERLAERLVPFGTLARLGGDEFALVVPGLDDDGLPGLLSTISDSMRQPFIVDGLALELGTSVGVSLAPRDGTDVDTLVKHADIAMYQAKQQRSGWALYDATLDSTSPARLILAGELRRAIDDGSLRLQYQPKLTLATGRVEGVEALVRWAHPELGVISPADFVDLAEHTGLIRPLTDWVLDAAIAQAAAWRREGRNLSVAVNLSARSLMDERFAQTTAAVLARHGLPGSALQLEITENVIMADTASATRLLRALRELGITLAIDDYGTGYSSLAYLRRLPVQQLKIDRSLVHGITTSRPSHAIVASTISLCSSLGLHVVAEGVEDEQTLRELRRLGCHQAQGFHLSRPVDGSALVEWLDARAGSDPAPFGVAALAS